MASNWRWNTVDMGITFEPFVNGPRWNTLAARLRIDRNVAWAKMNSPNGRLAALYFFNPGTEVWEYVAAIEPPASEPNFPYGFDVEPDH